METDEAKWLKEEFNLINLRLDRMEAMLVLTIPKKTPIDKKLRADILKALSHGKSPRKQPKPDVWVDAWLKKKEKEINTTSSEKVS